MKPILFVITIITALLLSACGPKATPTIDPVQVQASAIAAASTMVAMTQAAIPTATPLPPTPLPSPTLLPSPTFIPLPTLSELASPTPASSGAGGDPCNAPLAKNAAGPVARNVLVSNETKYAVILSLYLNKTPFGECGYRGFNINAHQSITLSDLKIGCYFAGAFVGDKSKAFGNFCIMDDSHKWNIRVGTEVIGLVGP